MASQYVRIMVKINTFDINFELKESFWLMYQ